MEPSDAPAVVDAASGSALTFRDLIHSARDLVAPMGRTKRLLLLLCRNDVFTATVYAGALLEGHAVALVDAGLPLQSIADLVTAYEPDWIAGPPGRMGDLEELGVFDRGGPEGDDRVRRTNHGGDHGIHPDLAVLLATSGTTGGRKFVRLSGRNIDTNARSIAHYLHLDRDERPITSLPIHYSFGLSVLDSHWVAGAAVVVTDESVLHRDFWSLFRNNACTSLAGVPFTFQMLERIGFRSMDLPTLRTLQQAGGALDRTLTRTYAGFMAARGGRMFVMYGQTEATARIAYVPPESLLEKVGSAGIAIPGGRLSIDADVIETADGRSSGEVVYEGPNVMLGYATGSGDLAKGDELGGALRTGDIGYLDGDGFLYLIGRTKRIAKVFGVRVNLDEVEAIVREHGPAAVVGGEDALWCFCAFGDDTQVADLGRSLARSFRLHPSTLRFRHVPDIPTTAAGKTDYAQVMAWTE